MSGERLLWAHSPGWNSARWHRLEDHLRGTADLARRFAAPFGGGEVAYWLGALHDVGKASCAWQDKLTKVADSGERVGIDHKSLGTRIAHERGLGGYAGAIFGHHGGLIDASSLGQSLKQGFSRAKDVASAEAELPRLLPDLPANLRHTIPEPWLQDRLVGEMALRLCYSALADADGLDTGAHFDGQAAPRVRADTDFDHLYQRFAQRRATMLAERKPSPVDALREYVYDQCLSFADQPPGIYRLPAPTGAGKTLCAAGFALRHATRHQRRRVIVAVPFLTITGQNAAVYRGMLDEPGAEPVVLEHHSQVNFDDGAAGRWGRLAAENWDAPFIVTTFVRLFESLFGRRPSAMRRVHRLAGSVIVLDEVQALPHDMLVPILDGLRLLVQHFGATVLLSSATQPEFWSLPTLQDVEYVDVLTEVPAVASQLKRVRYEWQLDPAPTLADIADQAADAVDTPAGHPPAAMVVVNTTANAQAVFDTWRDNGDVDHAWHLSTRMCPAHRQRVLETVRDRLTKDEPVLLVSTQLIEAGVDVDFAIVYRAMAPADSLLQAAGRANREGRLDHGRVVIFAPADGSEPPTYRRLVDSAATHFGPDKADPDDPDALAAYYRSVYSTLNLNACDHVGQEIQRARVDWAYQTVADGPLTDSGHREHKRAFRIISEDGISVVTPQGAGTPTERAQVRDLIERVRTAAVPDLRDLRRLQPYTTTVHPSVPQRDRGIRALMLPILGTEVRVGALVEWRGDYDPHTGMIFDPKLEDFIL
ncbi:CRISPR-associated helicase Cas3' [Micromonospora sp. LOL_023]|uniref:CRISPR-associated helicase Cas3' n=1 Tax=Micromonospora sp. LOL_023 TaxID=3345418 RepID=UPI003A8C05F9